MEPGHGKKAPLSMDSVLDGQREREKIVWRVFSKLITTAVVELEAPLTENYSALASGKCFKGTSITSNRAFRVGPFELPTPAPITGEIIQ